MLIMTHITPHILQAFTHLVQTCTIVFMNVLEIGILLKIMTVTMKVRNLKSLPALTFLPFCNVLHICVCLGHPYL